MGHVRSRFFTHLPANTPVQPQEIPSKFLFGNIFPAKPLFPSISIGNPSYPQQNKDLRGEGGTLPLAMNRLKPPGFLGHNRWRHREFLTGHRNLDQD